MSCVVTQLVFHTAEHEALSLDSTGVAVPTLLRYSDAVCEEADSHRREEGLYVAFLSFCGGIRTLQGPVLRMEKPFRL